MQIQLDQKSETIKELESKIREDEALRRKLHNTIQELKGNIRVFCRIRPLLSAEVSEFGSEIPFEFPPNSDKSLDISTSRVTSFTFKKDGCLAFYFTDLFLPLFFCFSCLSCPAKWTTPRNTPSHLTKSSARIPYKKKSLKRFLNWFKAL